MTGTRDTEALLPKLRGCLREGHLVTGLRPLTTGHSNETYLIEGLDRILRLPPVSAPLMQAHDIIVQARVYAELGAAADGPPVPGIFEIVEDPAVLGAPFFIMECVAGDSVNDYQLPQWFLEASAGSRHAMCAEWIAAVGALARRRPLDALGAAVSPESEAQRWRDIAVRSHCDELVTLFDRLLGFPAARSGPDSVVHGDCKIANMMFAGGHLTAVLDWELGYNGEPLCDLGYLLYFFGCEVHGPARASHEAGMFDRSEVIAGWEAASGRSAGGVGWYEALALGKISAILAGGYDLYASGESSDERFLRFKVKRDESIAIMAALVDRITL